MRKIVVAVITTLFFTATRAQETFPRNGVNDEREHYYALTHANLWIDYQTLLADATLIIRNGRVEATGKNLPIPAGAQAIDLKGKYVYPSFIDLFSDYGIDPPRRKEGQNQGPQFLSDKKGAFHWNQAIHPETQGEDLFHASPEAAKALRENGFGMVSTHLHDGLMRGTGVLVLLGDDRENELIIKNKSAGYYSFNKGISTQDYPTSLMGSIALLRQTYYDAQWYSGSGSQEEKNQSLEALNGSLKLPGIFEVNDVFSALRADKLGDEFNIPYIIRGSGDEYQRISELKATGSSLIIPLDFPPAFDFSDPYDAQLISLADMMHWEMAPANPAALEKAGIPFAITPDGLKDKKDFWKNLRKAVEYGLTEKQALKSLTNTPAQLLGVYNETGSLEKGKLANFIICSDSLFSEKNVLYQNWVKGVPYIIQGFDFTDIRGQYDLVAGSTNLRLTIEGSMAQPSAVIIKPDSSRLKAAISRTDQLVTLSFRFPADSSEAAYLLSGFIEGQHMKGTGTDTASAWIAWSATYRSALEQKKAPGKKAPVIDSKVLFPFTGYGNDSLPQQETFLFRNATIWTNEADGIMQNSDVIVSGGKIQKIGTNLPLPSGKVREIDCNGKHLTPGIIDEHSHIAIQEGVNEAAQSVTAEVRIGDVLNPNDINIYRQLAGGVTSSHLLHGSANAIGGQTQLIKLRWGYAAEALKFEGWPGFIKFALGENVKQSNWGDQNTSRFPQTRMGVEQTMLDAFIRARDYQLAWQRYDKQKPKEKEKAFAPRRDLELDALVEILSNKRFITCHSYVQSEINMLMHLADSLDFTVNTFTHILEGYKVADKMKTHGAYASSFSDWWAYKFEVYDAIPHNPALLTKAGVITAVNSDDAEMARRLNQEAAKSVKYGGLTEEEAFKLCTINPAKMLHVDDRVGSIKAGKDADLALWTQNPLSIYAECVMTLVDGILFYSEEQDLAKQEWILMERNRLMNEMARAKQKGETTIKPTRTFNRQWHCDTITSGDHVGN